MTTAREKNQRAAANGPGIFAGEPSTALLTRFRSMTVHIEYLTDSVGGFPLRLVISPDQQLGNQAHQDRLKTHNKNHRAHLEERRAQYADLPEYPPHKQIKQDGQTEQDQDHPSSAEKVNG